MRHKNLLDLIMSEARDHGDETKLVYFKASTSTHTSSWTKQAREVPVQLLDQLDITHQAVQDAQLEVLAYTARRVYYSALFDDAIIILSHALSFPTEGNML